MDYYQKYLKYKSKYIELKSIIGGKIRGESGDCTTEENNNSKKTCNSKYGCIYKKDIQQCKQKHCFGRSVSGHTVLNPCDMILGCESYRIKKNRTICQPICGEYDTQERCGQVDECAWDNNDNTCNPDYSKSKDIIKK